MKRIITEMKQIFQGNKREMKEKPLKNLKNIKSN